MDSEGGPKIKLLAIMLEKKKTRKRRSRCGSRKSMKFRDRQNLMFCNKSKELTTFCFSWPPNFASDFLLNFMFFLEPLLDLLFLVFSKMMAKNVILGPPSESTGAQNGAQNRTFSHKNREKTPGRSLFAFLEPTCFQDPIYIIC